MIGEFTLHQTRGALAAQPVVQAYAPEPSRAVPNLARAVQRSLFPDRQASNVVPIALYSPAPPRPPAATAHRSPSRRPARVPEGQASLDFLPPAPARPRTLSTTVDAVIYCEERVASSPHRALAAALDWSMVLIGYGLFLGMFAAMAGAGATVRAGVDPCRHRDRGHAMDAAAADDLRRIPSGAKRAPAAVRRFVLEPVHGDWAALVAGRRRRAGVAGPHFADVPDAAARGLAGFSQKIGRPGGAAARHA
jgi:hypothetical protein